MQKNRKKADTYRFNGLWAMQPVGIAELQSLIRTFSRKLADLEDADDKKRTARWLQRFQRELTKKERSPEQRQTAETKAQRRSYHSTQTMRRTG
jgi:hypothetical protein